MARPTNRQQPKTFEITLPEATFEYLAYLATHTTLGVTENAVAAYLIGKAVEEMLRSKFHEIAIPRLPLPPVTKD